MRGHRKLNPSNYLWGNDSAVHLESGEEDMGEVEESKVPVGENATDVSNQRQPAVERNGKSGSVEEFDPDFHEAGLSELDVPSLFCKGSLESHEAPPKKKIKAPRMVFNSHTKAVLAVTVLQLDNGSPFVISGGEDKQVIVSSLATGKEVMSLDGHVQKIASVCTCHHNDSAYIVSGSWDETIRCWPVSCLLNADATTLRIGEIEKSLIKKKSLVLKGHKNRVYDIDILRPRSADPLIASASADNTVRIWSVHHSVCLHIFSNISATWNLTVGACYSAKTGPVIVVGCKSSQMKVWGLPADLDSMSYAPLEDAMPTSKPPAIEIIRRNRSDSNSQDFGSSCHDYNAVGSFRLIRDIKGHPSRVTNLCVYNPDTYYQEHGEPEQIEREDSENFQQTNTSNDEDWNTKRELEEIRKSSKKKRFSGGHDTDKDSPVVVTTCRDFVLRMWSIETGDLLKCFLGNTAWIHAIFIQKCPDGEAILLNTSASGNIRVWDLETGELRRLLSGHTDESVGIYSFTSPENDSDLLVLSGSSDCTVRFWTFKEERSLTVLRHNIPHRSRTRVSEVVIYQSTEQSKPVFITGCTNGSIYGWSLGEDLEGDLVWVTNVHHDQVTSLAVFHPAIHKQSQSLKSPSKPKQSSYSSHLDSPLVISGGRDSMIRVIDLFTGNLFDSPLQGHDDAITGIAIYPGGHFKSDGESLIQPFVASSSEDNHIRIWSLETFDCIKVIKDHDFDVTSVALYAPPFQSNSALLSSLETDSTESLSAANDSKKVLAGAPSLPSLLTGSCCVPTPISRNRRQQEKKKISMNTQSSVDLHKTNIIIVSSSLDGTVRLYDFEGEEMKVLMSEHKSFSIVTVMNSTDYPMVAAGTLSGTVYVWSLEDPYSLLNVFNDHVDEIVIEEYSIFAVFMNVTGWYYCQVRALTLLLTPSLLPVLVSGSWDTTILVYDLHDNKRMKTIEGQSNEITGLAATSYGGNEPMIASSSSDGTVHIYFDFLSSAASKDVVMIAFDFDIKHSKSNNFLSEESWPRISSLMKDLGPKSFFVQHHELFFKAIKHGHAHFIAKFLPMSEAALVKTNSSPDGSLLYVAMYYRDMTAVRAIVDCWVAFLTTIPQDSGALIYQDHAQIPKQDLLILSYLYPQEFEKLISSLILIPVPDNRLGEGTKFLKGEKMYLGEVNAEAPPTDSEKISFFSRKRLNAVVPDIAPSLKNNDRFVKVMEGANEVRDNDSACVEDRMTSSHESSSKALKTYKFYFLPLPGMVDVNMLRAYTMTARSLDSFKIFNSVAGKMCQRFVWRVHGRRLHVRLFKRYVAYVFFSSTSIYFFPYCIERPNLWPIMGTLLVGQLLYDLFYLYSERKQFLDHPMEYIKDVWNRLDICIIMFGMIGNVIRITTGGDTNLSRVSLSIFSITLWFNLLYFLRAFESTGPLVSMIYHIAIDMRALLVVVALVCIGFSQAFWLLSNTTNSTAYEFQQDLPFSSIKNSFVNSFSYLLGNFEADAFSGLPLENFALILSTVYMLIVAILLLNLLIALMGDTYSYVSSRGLAQWRLEQLDYVVENSHSKSRSVKRLEHYTLYFATLHEDELDLSTGRTATNDSAADAERYHDRANSEEVAQLRKEVSEIKNMLNSMKKNVNNNL